MAEDNDILKELSDKLDRLLSIHNEVSSEIDVLKVEIIKLRLAQNQSTSNAVVEDIEIPSDPVEEIELNIENLSVSAEEVKIQIGEQNTDYFQSRKRRIIGRGNEPKSKSNFDIEKLIGENLINKIGMVVLIIGVALLAKYSIDNDWIGPLGRIILGYTAGVVLLGLGMWLKKNYLNYSAVLVSGAMAIFYFITYFAFSYYQLISQEVAFGLMAIFTIFTVIAALNYDKQVISHLGLVGAVSVPFLLSNDSGNALFLFSYIAIINLGIAFISLKKHWNLLFYSSFAITWIVYFTWIGFNYDTSEHFSLAFSFLTVFFILFYVIFIAYKFLNLRQFTIGDIIILLLNSLIFFGAGYTFLDDHEVGNQLMGAFALVNAAIHFIAATIINKRKLADRNLFYLIIGLVIVSLTLAIPIQLEGFWITIMWSMEALILFYIGRSKKVAFYEYLSYSLIVIAGFSLAFDWGTSYLSMQMVEYNTQSVENKMRFPLFNNIFLTSFISCICMGLIYWIHKNIDWKSESKLDAQFLKILDYAIPVAFLTLVYFAFRLEIMHYFTQLYAGSFVESNPGNNSFAPKIYNHRVRHEGAVWLLNYKLIFFSLLSLYSYKKVNISNAKWALIIFNTVVILLTLISGLYDLSELREKYLSQFQAEFFDVDKTFIWLRYLFIGLVALLIFCTYKLLKITNKSYKIYAAAETVFYLIVLWISTSELIHWLDFTEKSDTYGLALSIFWGIFSVIIIAFGIWKKKKHLRILGIVIFAFTLVKLFFYDLSNLTTIKKTIVMISLGALMLLTSFLYNKYTIEDEGEV